jgi:hypothetical protein
MLSTFLFVHICFTCANALAYNVAHSLLIASDCVSMPLTPLNRAVIALAYGDNECNVFTHDDITDRFLIACQCR